MLSPLRLDLDSNSNKPVKEKGKSQSKRGLLESRWTLQQLDSNHNELWERSLSKHSWSKWNNSIFPPSNQKTLT